MSELKNFYTMRLMSLNVGAKLKKVVRIVYYIFNYLKRIKLSFVVIKLPSALFTVVTLQVNPFTGGLDIWPFLKRFYRISKKNPLTRGNKT